MDPRRSIRPPGRKSPPAGQVEPVGIVSSGRHANRQLISLLRSVAHTTELLDLALPLAAHLSAGTFHRRIQPSAPAVYTKEPSGAKTTALTFPSCPRKTWCS